MKVALLQYNFLIGDFDYNKDKIIRGIKQVTAEGAEIAVFPELAVTGYPPQDFLEFEDFIKKSEAAIMEIAAFCNDIAVIIGAPSRNLSGKGKPLFNSAWFLYNGKVEYVANKALLPNYDVFDEYRYFEPSRGFGYVDFKGRRIALTICEDIWNTAEVPMYSFSPLDELNSFNPDIIINISASPFNYNQTIIRREVLRANALKYGKPIIYVNQTGAQTELIFDGNSMICDAKGNIRDELSFFTEEVRIIEISEAYYTGEGAPAKRDRPDAIPLVYEALVLGIKDYFHKMGFKKAILGLSGGIDSAVVMVLAAQALGKENVLAVLLPSKYSSDHSITDARQLAENLGCPYEVVPIAESVGAVEETMKPLFEGTNPGITEENIQARMRAVILMALSNKFGYILLNTSNKSEAAVGYGTLYGDMCGGISVLGDVYKTDVYRLAEFINKDKEIIPVNTITKPLQLN